MNKEKLDSINEEVQETKSQETDVQDMKVNKKTNKKDKKKNTLAEEIFSWVKTIALALILAFLITQFLIVNAVVPSASMETTVMTGDRLVANRLAYSFGKPERFDIVVFKYPDDESILYIKRIIGMPGETIRIENGNVYIEGEADPLRCDFVNGSMNTSDPIKYPAVYTIPKKGDNIADYTGISDSSIYDADGDGKFDEDCYFMMGDNRDNSSDSRFWQNTFVSENKIEGKAIFRYWPFSSIGTIN